MAKGKATVHSEDHRLDFADETGRLISTNSLTRKDPRPFRQHAIVNQRFISSARQESDGSCGPALPEVLKTTTEF